MKWIQSYVFKIQLLLDRISETDDSEILMDCENKLYALVVAPMLFLAATLNLVFGFIWNSSLLGVVSYSVTLVGCAIGIYRSAHSKAHYPFKVKWTGFFTFLAILVTIFAYYGVIPELLWFIMFIVTMMVSNHMDRTMLIYTMVGYGVLFALGVYKGFSGNPLERNVPFFVILFVMIGLLFYVSMMVSKVYGSLLIKKMERSKLLEQQRKELEYYNRKLQVGQERLKFLAYNDPLTKLPNRKMILEETRVMIDLGSAESLSFAMVFIDLDNFKRINDTMGHSQGDSLLCQVAERLEKTVDSRDLIGRLGGDEMALLVRRSLPESDLLFYIQRFQEALNEPFFLGKVEVHVTGSFGIAVFPTDATTAEDLIRAADTAMYRSKELGKNMIRFFHKEMRDAILEKLHLENRMIHAIEKNEFFLVYQPLYHVREKRIIGFEALIRWQMEPDLVMTPNAFIPLAEETGLIHEIGEWVIRTACHKVIQMEDMGRSDLTISVNVSSVQMQQQQFANRVKQIILETGVDPEKFYFEITESVFINNMERASQMIEQLRKLGIKIALDDFGTGYSSLSYLTRLPIDILKIDKSFIDYLKIKKDHDTVVGNIIDLAHGLGMTIIAEGVEDVAQSDFLHSLSCDVLQGYYIGVPLAEEAMMDLVTELPKAM
jgi:diguanylate cyclase (GGDEF)-like protein